MKSRKIITVLSLVLLILPAIPTNVLAPSTQTSPAVSIHTCTIHLHQGWNLISIPISDIGKASDLKSLIGNNCTAIARWDTSLGRFITHPTETGISNFKVEPQYGYFVNVIDDTVFQVQGQAVVNINISLENGWNLLGWFDPLSTYANNLIGKINYCTHINKWDNNTQNFEIYPGNNFKINYCEGFFVYIEQKSRWSYELKDTDGDGLYDIWEENGFNITKETTGETLTNISTGLTQNLNSIAWKTDGSYALMVGNNGTIAKYDEKKTSTINSGTNKNLYSVAWRHDGASALISGKGIVLNYDAASEGVTKIKENINVYYDIAYKPDGQYAFIASSNGTWKYDGSLEQIGLIGTICKAVEWNWFGEEAYISTNGAIYKYDGMDFQKIQTLWDNEEILSMAPQTFANYMLMAGKYKPYDDTWPVLATYNGIYDRVKISDGEYTYSNGTENVCLSKTVSTGGTVNNPEYAVDGSGSTYANLVAYNFGSCTAWLSVNLGQNYVISHMDAAIAWNNFGTPTGYMYLQANIGGGWTNIYQRGASETTWEQIHSLPIYTNEIRFYENIDGTGPSNIINICLYEFRAFKAIPNGDLGTLKNVAWKPDYSKALIAGVSNQNKGILLKYNNTKVTTVQNTSEQLNSISWRPDGSYALIAGNNGTLIKYMDYNTSYEYIYTDPNNNDTDGDGILDGEEILGWEIIVNDEPVTVFSLPAGINALDSDNDGISDHDERFIYHTNPSNHDTDEDGIGDYEETHNYFPYEKVELENYIPNNKIEYSETHGYLINSTYRVHENGTALYITNTSNYGEWLPIFLDIREEGDYKIYVRGKTSTAMPSGVNSTLYMNINSSSFTNYVYPRYFETHLLGSKHLSKETHNISISVNGGLIIDYIYLERKGMNATNHDSDGDGLLDGGSKNINEIEYKGEYSGLSYNCYPLSPDTDRDCVYDSFEAYNGFNPNPAEQKDKVHTIFLLPVNATHASRTMINERFYVFMLNVNVTNKDDLIEPELKDPYGANLLIRGLNEIIASESIFYRAFYDNTTGEIDLSLINDTAIGEAEENQTKWFRSNESVSTTNITVIVCDTNGTKASNLMRKLLFNETNSKVAVGSIVTDEINELKLPDVLLDMTANLSTHHSIWEMFAGIAGEAWNLMTGIYEAWKEIAIKIYKIAVNITQKIANKIWEGITWLANGTTKLSAEFNKRVIQPIKDRWNNFKNEMKQTVNEMLNTTCKDLKDQLRTYLPVRVGVFNVFQKFVDNPDSTTASDFVTATTSIVRIGVPFMQLTGVLSSIQTLVLCGVMSQDEAENMVNETATRVFLGNQTGEVKGTKEAISFVGGPDSDGDGIPDKYEPDYVSCYADGTSKGIYFKDDPDEWIDIDGDGIGSNADIDDDNDGINDTDDQDDDNDGIPDVDEIADGTDPNNPDSDYDGFSDGYNVTVCDKNYVGELYMGTNASRPDLFIEIDWTPGCKPMTDEDVAELRQKLAMLGIVVCVVGVAGVITAPAALAISGYILWHIYGVCSPMGDMERYFKERGVTVHWILDEEITNNTFKDGVFSEDDSQKCEEKYHQQNRTHVYAVFVNSIEDHPGYGGWAESFGAVVCTGGVTYAFHVLGIGYSIIKISFLHEMGHCIGIYQYETEPGWDTSHDWSCFMSYLPGWKDHYCDTCWGKVNLQMKWSVEIT